MKKKAEIKIKIIFGIRIFLWVTAFASTAYWIWYSFKLYNDGIVLPEEYSPLLRPVLYRGIIISVAAIVLSFVLRSVARKIKKNNDL